LSLITSLPCKYSLKKQNEEFCARKNVFVFCDPPFGVMANVLHRTFSTLCKNSKTFIFFPWYSDSRLADFGYKMMDYRVKYKAHAKMNRNSTVRIFSNAPLEKIKLPDDEYKLCAICKRYVYITQFHCSKCGGCQDRSGREVRHCDKCQKCVVKKHVHCDKCGKCTPGGPERHDCGKRKGKATCFLCGKAGHKQSECPVNNTQKTNDTE
jgi:hypothetical protein